MIERIVVHYEGVNGPTDPGENLAIAFIATINEKPFVRASAFLKEHEPRREWVAEYTALIQALMFLENQRKTGEQIRMFGDDIMIVNQMSGLWQVKPEQARWFAEANTLAKKFKNIAFTYVSKAQILDVRALATKELTDKGIDSAEMVGRANSANKISA